MDICAAEVFVIHSSSFETSVTLMPFSKIISIYCWDFFKQSSSNFFVSVQIKASLYIIQLMRELMLSISNSG